MNSLSILLSDFKYLPKFLLFVIFKGALEIIAIGLLIFLIIISILSFQISFLLGLISLTFSFVFLFFHIYWIWLLSLSAYIFVSRALSENNPSVVGAIKDIFKYPFISNVFLIIVVGIIYILFNFILVLISLLIGNISAGLSIIPFAPLIVLFFGGVLFLVINSISYFIIGYIKFTYINLMKARASLITGLELFTNNLKSTFKGVILLVILLGVITLIVLAISSIQLGILQGVFSKIFSNIYLFLNSPDIILEKVLAAVDAILLIPFAISFIFGLILNAIAEFIKLTVVYRRYILVFKESTK